MISQEVVEAGKLNWAVESVEARRDFTLFVKFADGTTKIFDMKPLLRSTYYHPLEDVELFMRARVVSDTVAWNEEIDIAPEILYGSD